MSDTRKQLPKLELRTNIPERLGFPYGDAKYLPSKKEGWAPQYLITVDTDEGAAAWFASETIWNMLLEAGVGKGGIADITKGEAKGSDGKLRTDWKIDVIDPGTPVANPVRGGPGAPERAATGSAPSAGVPGTREGAEGRLGELGAAYAACVDEAKGVWLRASHGVAGKLDHETLHSTAAVFMIQLQREGFDLAVFANTYGESQGLRALRKLIERARSEPHLTDVREHFGAQLDSVPPDAQTQRALYASLRAAVTTATQIAAENTPAPATYDDLDDPGFGAADIGPIPDTGHPPKITGGAKPAAKPEPAWVGEMIRAAKTLWGEDYEGELAKLIVRVTRSKEPLRPAELVEAQAKTVGIVMANQIARQQKGQ